MGFISRGEFVKNIIVIDKTPSIRRIKEIAEELGVNVIEANSSVSAYRKLREVKFDIDLVVIDVMLESDGEGIELIEKIKSDAPSVPIVILTALGKRVDIIRGLKAGAVDYILKPFEDETIKKRVFSHLEKRDHALDKNLKADQKEILSILRSEIVKSKKGRYPLTILMAVFYDPQNTQRWSRSKSFNEATERFTESLKNIFFETDYVYTFEANTMIAILPFCPKENIGIIDAKLEKKGQEMLEKAGFDNNMMSFSYVSLPFDARVESADDAIEALFGEIEELVIDRRQSRYEDGELDLISSMDSMASKEELEEMSEFFSD